VKKNKYYRQELKKLGGNSPTKMGDVKNQKIRKRIQEKKLEKCQELKKRKRQ